MKRVISGEFRIVHSILSIGNLTHYIQHRPRGGFFIFRLAAGRA